MVTRKDKRRECPHCGRVTDNPNETTCTACGYLTREVKKVVTKGTESQLAKDLASEYTMSVDEAAKALNKAAKTKPDDEGMVDLSEEEK